LKLLYWFLGLFSLGGLSYQEFLIMFFFLIILFL
jgi:hypothetical protein